MENENKDGNNNVNTEEQGKGADNGTTTNSAGQDTGGQQKQQQGNKNSEDLKAAKSEAIKSLLSSIGVDNEEALKSIVSEYNKQKESQMSDAEKKDALIKKLTGDLVTERELRIVAEAKIQGIKLGANKDLIDDLVIVAKSKVTDDKDIATVMSEMKEAGAVYFKQEENQQQGTSGKGQKKKGTNATDIKKDTGKTVESGSEWVDRIFKKTEKKKSSYFG